MGHVIACDNNSALGRNIFPSSPISLHQKIEDGNNYPCANFESEICS